MPVESEQTIAHFESCLAVTPHGRSSAGPGRGFDKRRVARLRPRLGGSKQPLSVTTTAKLSRDRVELKQRQAASDQRIDRWVLAHPDEACHPVTLACNQ